MGSGGAHTLPSLPYPTIIDRVRIFLTSPERGNANKNGGPPHGNPPPPFHPNYAVSVLDLETSRTLHIKP